MLDNYYGSPYNHWDYQLFKDVKPFHIKNKKRGFLASLGNVRYVQESNTLLLYKLIDYYKNLNDNLKRILDNYHDDMFMRFVFRAKVFGNEERFVEFLQIWDDLFSVALEDYIKRYHDCYDETFGISYVMYFNLKFSKCLVFNCLTVLKQYNNRPGYEEGFRYCRDVENISLRSSTRLGWTPLEYPSENYYQELIYQSFSP